MAKPDWREIQRRFLSEYAKSGISPKEWCEAQGLNYATARRYIKKSTAQKTAQKKAAQSTKKTAQKKERENKKKSSEEKVQEEKIIFSEVVEDGYDSSSFGLSPQQALFAQYVTAGKTRVEAYKLAGYKCTGNNAYFAASQVYRNIRVSRYVRHLRDKLEKRQAATIDDLIHQYTAIANADPNELAQHRRVNCRYCWGEYHLYQWRDVAEFDRASASAAKDGKQPPEYGGRGFVNTADPHPDCPKCGGEGISEVFITDTRDLEGNARWLYAGVKETKFGIEVQTASQDAARRELSRLLTARHGAGSLPTGMQPVTGYTPEDYRKAQDWINSEFGDLD
ncbi:terminase small subunit [Superficieibacter electus]|uniref:Terminase small subunit n=1 Tax=Superficieibacter electus TaxID=2022662 RepID=A0ABX4Z982_9ENTR|nr:terminase small subunit [Superficieibacter electus]POP42338.1 terminase small subunit [Superficieibacter electus]